MYLINKDETEHTGQVSVIMHKSLSFLLAYIFLFPFSSHFVSRNPMCGKCTKRDAGTSSRLVTVSESNMRINSARFRLPVD